MGLFNKKKVEEQIKVKQEAPEEFKERISNTARILKDLLFSKKTFDIRYGEIEPFDNNTIKDELQSMSAVFFDKVSKTLYKVNMRAIIPHAEDKEVSLMTQSLETLKLGENNEIAEYTRIENVHHYHPYQEDTYGEIKQSWNKEDGYITSKTESDTYIYEGTNRVITNILEDVVKRDISSRKIYQTKQAMKM